MGWKDQLRDASFKGVPIKWLDISGENGRRLADHEFPQRDRPWIEDMGRATRPYAFTAVCCGDSWLDDLNTLLAIMEAPGAGELVHPLFGRVTVYAKPAKWHMAIDDGPRVDVALEFTENGDLLFPTKVQQTASKVDECASGAITAAQAQAESELSALDLAKAKVKDVVDAVNSAVKGYDRAVKCVLAEFESWQQLVNTVLTLPAKTVAKVMSTLEAVERSFDRLTDLTRWGLDQSKALRTLRKRAKALRASKLGTTSAAVAVVLLDVLVAGIAANLAATMATLPTSRSSNSSDMPVAADVAGVKASLATTLWELADGASFDVSQAFLDLRSATTAHLQVAASVGLSLRTVTTTAVLPALVLAWREQGDASQVDELISRNGITHPLFVPAGEVQVTRD